MALSTYSDLQTAIASWLHRDGLDTNIPDFIALAEARMNRDLRLRQGLSSTTLSTVASTSTVALPSDFLEFYRVKLSSPERELQYVSRGQYLDTFSGGYTDSPWRYTIEGGNMVLGPVPDSAYSIEAVYYAKPTPLATGSTNWVLTNCPGLYLFGSLAEAAPFLKQEPERVALWESKYRSTLQEAKTADERASASGSALRVRSF